MKNEIILCLVMILLAAGIVEAHFNYDIVSLPFQTTETANFTGIENDTLSWNCTRVDINTTCIYTSPEFFNYTFPPSNISNETNETNITLNIGVLFNVSVPNGTANQQILERYDIYRNGLLDDFLSFNINVSIPPPAQPAANITITSISPDNGSMFNMFSTLPTQVEVDFDGQINWSKSTMTLKFNNQSVAWIHRTINNNSVIFVFLQVPDGTYTGDWVLYDTQNNSLPLIYNYVFKVRTVLPPLPIEVYPNKGGYTDDVTEFRVRMNNTDFSVWYIVKDELPIETDSWIGVPVLGSSFVISNFDFQSQGIGAVYLKIVDEFGNFRITPTGIISKPSFTVSVADRSRTVTPGDLISMDVTIDKKPGSGHTLSCRLKDFVSSNYNGTWYVRNRARLIDSSNDDFMTLGPDYSDSLDIGTPSSKTLSLEIDVPTSGLSNDDYISNLECVLR